MNLLHSSFFPFFPLSLCTANTFHARHIHKYITRLFCVRLSLLIDLLAELLHAMRMMMKIIFLFREAVLYAGLIPGSDH